MDFSESFKCSSLHLVHFSPNGTHVANAVGHRLVIRDVETLQVMKMFQTVDEVSQLEWSRDSKYILTVCYKRGIIEIWGLFSNFTAKIDMGAAGCSFAFFSPNASHVLAVSDFQLRLVIWSLQSSEAVGHLKFLKYDKKGFAFTKHDQGKYLAIAERRDCKDYISIITTDTWELVKNFPVTELKQLENIKWSPDGRFIIAWDSILDYRVNVYNVSGSLVCSYSVSDNALGVKCVKWNPSSQLLALGSMDSKLRLLNSMTWKCVTQLDTLLQQQGMVIFKEVMEEHKSKYVLANSVITNGHGSSGGAVTVKWSFDGKYFCSRNEKQSNVLLVWETSKLQPCAMLIQLDSIKCVKFDPMHNRFALCTGNQRIYLWSVEGCSCVDVPLQEFRVHKLKWSQNGESLILMDQQSFCCCYINFI